MWDTFRLAWEMFTWCSGAGSEEFKGGEGSSQMARLRTNFSFELDWREQWGLEKKTSGWTKKLQVYIHLLSRVHKLDGKKGEKEILKQKMDKAKDRKDDWDLWAKGSMSR